MRLACISLCEEVEDDELKAATELTRLRGVVREVTRLHPQEHRMVCGGHNTRRACTPCEDEHVTSPAQPRRNALPSLW